jgi:uncharacterized membrane protein
VSLDLAVVQCAGEEGAVEAYSAAKERAGDAPWLQAVGFVEHHHGERLVLRGVFAGHYLDVDGSDRVSQKGAGVGAATGGLIGVLIGPPGIAVGILVGGLLGAELGAPSDTDTEPEGLVEQLRAAVPASSSAIVMIDAPARVDEMLAALGDRAQGIIRRTLGDDETSALEASLRTAPPPAPERT